MDAADPRWLLRKGERPERLALPGRTTYTGAVFLSLPENENGKYYKGGETFFKPRRLVFITA
jgi:hypothetical protein